MKFSEFVLSEGRKEDLLQKYMSELDVQVLDTILNDPFTKSTNYKYADWILKNLEFNSTPLATEVLELIKQFDRVGKNLEIKDLNQYPDVVELKHALENYTSKSQEKKIEGEADKIYEDDRVLIVKPLTHAASCKYGAGTKWCTTQSSPGYYEKHTTGSQGLYYVMMKDFDINNKFYKVALHIGLSGEKTWYDSHDTALPPREVDILEVGLGKKAMKNVMDDYSQNKNKGLYELFNQDNKHHFVAEKNLFGSGKPLVFEFSEPRLLDDLGNMAEMDFYIYLGNDEDEKIIEQGYLFISYKLNGNLLSTDIGFQEDDEFEAPIHINSLYGASFGHKDFPMNIPGDPGIFKRFCNLMSAQIYRIIKNDSNLQKYVLGDKKIWYPNRSTYGFTFERKGGLIQKLVDYLESGKEGNAIDFLIDAGKIKVVTFPHGTKKYVGKKGFIEPKGYFSSFFASAVRAGILRYKRKNKKNILAMGPNFDDFLEGNLKAL